MKSRINLGRTLGGVPNLGGESWRICAETGNDPDTELKIQKILGVWESLQAMLHGEWKGYH